MFSILLFYFLQVFFFAKAYLLIVPRIALRLARLATILLILGLKIPPTKTSNCMPWHRTVWVILFLEELATILLLPQSSSLLLSTTLDKPKHGPSICLLHYPQSPQLPSVTLTTQSYLELPHNLLYSKQIWQPETSNSKWRS